MSFSFTISAKTKDEVKELASAEMDKVISGQADHAHDKDAVVNACVAYANLLNGYEDGDTISLSVSGSLGWSSSSGDAHKYTGAGLNVSARCYKNQ